MNQIHVVNHPIPLEKKVSAMRPSCACRNAKLERVEGVVKKVIHNQAGYWYYLDIGVTVKGDWVETVK